MARMKARQHCCVTWDFTSLIVANENDVLITAVHSMVHSIALIARRPRATESDFDAKNKRPLLDGAARSKRRRCRMF